MPRLRAILAYDGFMSLCYPRRVPEPEGMDDPHEVAAYADAAAGQHLDRLDWECARAVYAAGAAAPGLWIDVGCGPGQIACKVAVLTGSRVVGIDISQAMLLRARRAAAEGGLHRRLFFVRARACALPFREATFDLVYSNSLLHHLARPETFFGQAASVLRRGGRFYLRDLARPLRWRVTAYLRRYGGAYSGLMGRLFASSVRAAYTPREARRLLQATPLRGLRVRRTGCYLTIE